MILQEALELHDTLNPKLYNEDNSLREDVSGALIDIANEFLNQLEENQIPIKVIDIWLVGSNASFNYSKSSDIDVHIIADLGEVSEYKTLLQILYNYAKSSFNKNYDIKVKGQEVEVYVEDVNTTSITNGIYSILHNEWIKFPQPIEIPDIDVEGSDLYQNFYNQYLNLSDEDIEDYVNRLYILRKASLSQEGEFGIGNLVFKELRNKGVLDDLKDRSQQRLSRELTLEKLGSDTSLQKGQTLIGYHGSDTLFDKFNLSRFGRNDSGQWGKGIYFTDSDAVPKHYGKYIYKCKLNFKKPYIVRDKKDIDYFLSLGKNNEESTNALREKGYDGVISYNEDWLDRETFAPFKSNQYCVYDPNIIEIIDVSERDQDFLKEELSEEQMLFFKDSKMKDSRGNLIPFYHGSNVTDIREFYDVRQPSFFSRSRKYAEDIGNTDDEKEERVYEVYLNIINPLDMSTQQQVDYLNTDFRAYLEKAGIPWDDKLYQFKAGKPLTFEQVDSDRSSHALYNFLRKDGKYDGIIVDENQPSYNRKIYGREADYSYVPLNANQIKLVSNTFPTRSRRIDENDFRD